MMKCRMMTLGAALAILTSGCGKKHVAGSSDAGTAEKLVEKAPPVATHLGFATRVPKDADLFVAGYHADQMFNGLVETFVKPEEMSSAPELATRSRSSPTSKVRWRPFPAFPKRR